MAREGDELTEMEQRMLRKVFELGTLARAARVVSVTCAANGYIDSAREKLGADDLPQLTVLADRKGLLEGVQPQPRRWKQSYAKLGDDKPEKAGYAPGKPGKKKKKIRIRGRRRCWRPDER